MRLTKRQLKRIIREEYTRLRRRGLLREYDSDTANQCADELMAAFPEGCEYDEGLDYCLSLGFTQEDYDYALDICAQTERGY
jgi:hypothetical protein